MSRISKEKAIQFSLTILQKNREELDKLKASVSTLAYQIGRKYVKPEILDLHDSDKLRDYLTRSNNASFYMLEKEAIKTSMQYSLPHKARDYKFECLVSKEDYETLKSAVEKISEKARELRELDKELVAVLLGLRTRKRILEEFPMIEKEWPEESRYLPSNIQSVKQKIIK